jgi:hypothetical protein
MSTVTLKHSALYWTQLARQSRCLLESEPSADVIHRLKHKSLVI